MKEIEKEQLPMIRPLSVSWVLNECVPSNLYVDVLTSLKVMVLGGEVFGGGDEVIRVEPLWQGLVPL